MLANLKEHVGGYGKSSQHQAFSVDLLSETVCSVDRSIVRKRNE